MSAQLRQQTLSFTKKGEKLPRRPGPVLKALTALSSIKANALVYSVKRRRHVGGVNEAKCIKAFRWSRDHFKAREDDSSDNSISDNDGLVKPSRKRRRIVYFKEKKLQAITYMA
jgi:hypothetical protein